MFNNVTISFFVCSDIAIIRLAFADTFFLFFAVKSKSAEINEGTVHATYRKSLIQTVCHREDSGNTDRST